MVKKSSVAFQPSLNTVAKLYTIMTDFNLFQSHLLSQSGNNTVLLMLFVIMTGFFYPDNLIFLSGLI